MDYLEETIELPSACNGCGNDNCIDLPRSEEWPCRDHRFPGIDTAADNEKNPNYDLFILPLNSILIAMCIVKRQMLQVTQVHMNEIFDGASFRRDRVN